MWAHYLLTFYRSITRRRLYAALNVLGLAVGIAVFLVLWLDVRFETSFERWIPHAEQIYQVRTVFADDPASGSANTSAGGLLQELREDYPQVVGTRISPSSGAVRQGGQVTSERINAVDASFFTVFDLPFVAGDRASALKTPDGVVLTQTKAKQYFGAADPIGRNLTVVLNGAAHVFRVDGVLAAPPANTDQDFDILILLTPQMYARDKMWTHFDFVTCFTFLKFNRPDDARRFASNLNAFVDRHSTSYLPLPGHEHIQFRLQPLPSMHLLNPKSAATIAALGVVGLLTAMLAAVNYVNLATVSAGLRAREVALRKVLGATAPSLRAQFMGEAMATVTMAGLIALCICELALPFVNAAGGLALKLNYWGPESVLPLLIGAVIVIGLGAGVYPALALSSFQPAAVLASTRSPGGGRAGGRLREALVVFQFAVATAFIIGAGVVVSQTNFVRGADLGFQRDGLIVISSFGRSDITNDQRASLLAAWRGLPGIVQVTAADAGPGFGDNIVQTVRRPGVKAVGQWISMVTIAPDFFKTYGMHLIAGRLLDTQHGADNFPIPPGSGDLLIGVDPHAPPAGISNVVLNANALAPLGFASARDAIGKVVDELDNRKFLRSYLVVGVVDNFRFGPPTSAIKGALYRMNFNPFGGEVAALRYSGAEAGPVMDRAQAIWRRIAPDAPFRAKTADGFLQHYYDDDEHQGHLFILGAGLAVLIGCVGLFGLASFNSQRRFKEIGIRKTLGASTGDVLRLLIGQFLRPVLVANLIAWPLAFLAMRQWLSSFDQKIVLGPSYFVAAAALTLIIAVGTVAGQAFSVARAEPAKALRHE